jgi:hypothetical protein
MGAHHDGVARLDGDEGLEDRGRGRVRGRDHCRHHAHGFRDLHDAPLLVLAQDPHRAQGADVFVDVDGGEEVLERLVLRVPEARLLVGQPAQALRLRAGGGRHRFHDAVHLLLRELLDDLLGLAGGGGEGTRLLDREEVLVADGAGHGRRRLSLRLAA